MAHITPETLKTERARYMAGEITHNDYYLWIADSIGVAERDLPVSVERVSRSTDPHLNDIPLRLWDNRHGLIRSKARRLPWSLSDTVCTLKAVARRAAADD